MKINIKATNITLTDSISEYLTKKINMLNKYFEEDEEVLVNVEVGKSTKHHKSGDVFLAEIHILSGGSDHYARVETPDLYASIDKVKDEMADKLSSKKKKDLHLWRRGALQVKMLLKGIYEAGGRGLRRFKRGDNEKLK